MTLRRAQNSFMPENINPISTLEVIEKLQIEKTTTKQSAQSRVCASVLKYNLVRQNLHF